MTALARPLPAATPLRWPLYWLLVLLLALPLWGADARANPLDQLGGGQQQILPAEEAFPLFLERIGEHRLLLTVDVAEGYYLYREKLAFEVRNGGVALTDVAIPEGREKDDPFFGQTTILRGVAQVQLQFDGPVPDDLRLEVAYRGCADIGVCYPPLTADLGLDGQGAIASGVGGGGGGTAGGAEGRLSSLLQDGSAWMILGGFFVAGLLLAFTACLYPMIPILSGLIAGDSQRGSGRALLLSFVYVQSVAITYALAGAAAGLTGRVVQAELQNLWVLGGFSLVLVLMAMAMFGLFTVQMPGVLQNRLDALSRRQKGGRLLGVAVMGMLSALIVGACSGPALIAALSFIGTTGEVGLGALALYVMALGMGLPLLLIGTAAGKWLPRSGAWMDGVRQLFGFVLLGVAIWMIERLLSDAFALALWGLLLIAFAVWVGWRLRGGRLLWRWSGRAVGLAALLWGAAALVGAGTGAHQLSQPLAGLSGESRTELAWVDAHSLDELDALREQAQAEGRPVMLDVTADWCIYCQQLKDRTFPDPGVQAALSDAKLVRVDVTAMDDAERALLEALGVFLPPAIIFYRADGSEARGQRVSGFLGAEEFRQRVDAALNGEPGPRG
ncbi:protein-disulfide reductase DsbD [Alkalilimnicola ehrlichii MLHE-1]|uniref:Cytochrome c biogenesis protein, transmembrane region n=1 Tax=Alkalilimnicola ehrlichii (strain ATCC BAA-1101 / DSM 17681 / MLHE-1) TaxID=187272 RepID=Q0ACQ6_ALKEH|nr:protein-disulfide reductase DsbD [Alkalilimnicola ehrlichii]ABI55381.1 cytochrome c biogenesis protein, transmembrane region [Alkalilimnicola ehrlichii MLHE-1]